MPERVSAAKAKREPKKPPVHAPSPDSAIKAPAPESEVLVSPSQTFSSQQLIHLQRTVGNKAVGDLISRQKASMPAVNLRTTANVIQPEVAEAPPAKKEISAPISVAPLAEDAEKGGTPNSDIVASEAQMANPVLALKTYREAVGVHLREGKRHKFKIERYKAFIQADYVHLKSEIPGVISEDKALKEQEAIKNQPAKTVKKLKAQRTALDERKKKLGGDQLLQTEAQAEARVQKAFNASVVAESELPMIEYAYDTLVKMRHDDLEGSKHGTLFGSGNPYERVKFYEKKLEHAILVRDAVPSAGVTDKARKANAKDAIEFQAHIDKQKARIAAIEQAKKDLIKAQTLRGQAKLSEDMMAVKRKQLKVEKASIKGEAGRGVTLTSHLGSKVVTAVGGAVVSTATLGIVELEQNKADGGYASKREVVTMLDTWKRDWAALKSVWTTRPYGKMTALHLFFQGLGNLILKPLRKMFTAAALIFTGLSLIPPLAPITGPLAAFCTLVTLGLVAAKMALDTVLATWSALTLALNKNAHNTDVLRGQAVGQVADVAAGAVAVGAAFAVPAIGNAAGGSYVNPVQNLTGKGGSIMNYDPGKAGGGGSFGDMIGHQAQVQGAKLPSLVGMIVAEKVVSAIAELEGLGDGAKALFMARQKEVMARNLPQSELFVELEKAKLDALIYAEGHTQKRIEFQSVQGQGNPKDLASAQAKLITVRQQIVTTRARIATASSGAPASTPTAAPSAPTTAKNIDKFDHSTTALPAQGQFAARTNPEVEKERTMRAASTQALGAKARSQVQALVGGLGESQSQGAPLASGAQAAASGVASAGAEQGVQPVDAPNASAAQENVGAAQDILQQVLAVAEAAPSAVDEALVPAPVRPS